VRALSERYRLPVDPHARVWQLSIGEQQRVEILNALYQDARVLLLDEPTAVLTPQEADTLFVTLRQMADDGRTLIFISHKLHEVKAVSDRVTVLRGGRTVATVPCADATPQSLANLMVGRGVDLGRRERPPGAAGREVLQVEGLSAESDRGTPAVRDVSFTVRAGEIVAIAGVAGNGQRELAEAIAGLRPREGEVVVDGRRLPAGDALDAYVAGVGYVPEDRLGTGVSPNLSIAMNLDLKFFRRRSLGPLLRLKSMWESAVRAIRTYDIRASGPGEQADHLSGGNLQKVVIAREFSGEVRVLVAASPTRGLDVGAVESVHSHLRQAAAGGTAILLISEDLDEILALNDRILVMYEGRLAEVPAGESIEAIGLRMAGQTPEPAVA